jgi:hypothetical protein
VGANLPDWKTVRQAKDKLVSCLPEKPVDFEDWQGKLAAFSDKMTWKRWAVAASALVVIMLLGLCAAFWELRRDRIRRILIRIR